MPSAPLNYEASAQSDPIVSPTLPPEVITCLKNARFLHLATCDDQTPHVSLMNYTYLPDTPFSSGPTIIMTTNPISKKTENLFANPRVSLLVHDWVSHRPSLVGRALSHQDNADNTPPARPQSSLASMLANINTSALSRISTTITGEARIVEANSEEEIWCKEQHVQNNTFNEQEASNSLFGSSWTEPSAGDGGRGCFIEGEAVRVVVVKIKDGRIADWKGRVQDWSVAPQAQSNHSQPMVNGV